jgi:ATP-binding cassette, subfamily C (CFTR/MRP), member 1
MFNPFHPQPAPPAFGSHRVIPEKNASILSRLVFTWLSPLLSVGFTRPLEADDLWQLNDFNKSKRNADLIEEHFYRGFEVPKATINTPATATDGALEKESDEKDLKSPSLEQEKPALESKSKKDKKRKKPSLIKSIHATYFKHIWLAGLFKLTGDTLQTTSPLVNKALLNWLTVSFLFAKGGGAGQADSTS